MMYVLFVKQVSCERVDEGLANESDVPCAGMKIFPPSGDEASSIHISTESELIAAVE